MASIESGTIFRFEIPFEMGNGYCKLIDHSSISQYYGITIKVYDYFSEKAISNPDEFRNLPLFMNPLPIAKMPSIKGKYAWKKLGVLIEESDSEIPVYKSSVKEGFAFNTAEKYINNEWKALVNLREKIGPIPFEKIRHLEELFLRSTLTIENRVAVQLLRYKKIDVKEFLSLNLSDVTWRTDYYTQMTIPLYRNIPEPIRGKPLIKGWVPDIYLNYDFGPYED